MDRTDNKRSIDYIHICSLRSQPEERRQKYTCTQQPKCKISPSSFSAFFFIWAHWLSTGILGEEGHADIQKKIHRKHFWKLNTHIHSVAYSWRKAMTTVFRKLQLKMNFVFLNYCNKSRLCWPPMDVSVPCTESLQIPRDPQESRPHMLQSFRCSQNSCRWQLSLDNAQIQTLEVNTEKLTLPEGMKTFHSAG